MRSEVSVTFAGMAPVRIMLEKVEPMSAGDAREWLDRQFAELGCEPPARPTGKVLAADKVAVVAEAAGASKFEDAAWAQAFARAATGMLHKPVVNIDVASLTISF